MTAADAGRLNGARGGKVGGAEAHAMHAGGGGGDRLDVVEALGGFEDRMNENGLLDRMARFELRQILVDEVDVPRSLDLGQHDNVEFVADLADEAGHVIEKPWRIERVDASPKARRAKVDGASHRDEALARRRFRLDGDRILEIAEDDVDVSCQVADLGAHLFDMRGNEMDHPLNARRQVSVRRRRADGEGFEEFTRGFHRRVSAALARMRPTP